MSRERLIARALLFAMVLNILDSSLGWFSRHGVTYGAVDLEVGQLVTLWLAPFLTVTFLGLYLLFDLDRWAGVLAGEGVASHPAGIGSQEFMVVMRLAAVFMGLVVLSRSADFVAGLLGWAAYGPKILVDMAVYHYKDEMVCRSPGEWVALAARVCRLALGLYLILGARGLVQWQLKRANIVPGAKL